MPLLIDLAATSSLQSSLRLNHCIRVHSQVQADWPALRWVHPSTLADGSEECRLASVMQVTLSSGEKWPRLAKWRFVPAWLTIAQTRLKGRMTPFLQGYANHRHSYRPFLPFLTSIIKSSLICSFWFVAFEHLCGACFIGFQSSDWLSTQKYLNAWVTRLSAESTFY